MANSSVEAGSPPRRERVAPGGIEQSKVEVGYNRRSGAKAQFSGGNQMDKTCDEKTDRGIQFLNDFRAGYAEEEAFLKAMEEAAQAYVAANPNLSPLGVVLTGAWVNAFEESAAYASEMQTLKKSRTIRKGLRKDDIGLRRFKKVAKRYLIDRNRLVRLIGKKWYGIFAGERGTNDAIRQALKR